MCCKLLFLDNKFFFIVFPARFLLMLDHGRSAAVPEDANVANEHRPDQPNTTPQPPQPSLGKRGATRRRLAKAGVGAAGILWTLESKATFNQGMTCAPPSGSLSTGLKSSYGQRSTCQGWPPKVWRTLGHFWPCSDKVMFASVFPCRGNNKLTYGKMSMLDILEGKHFDSYGIGAELVAAYLNVLSRKISFLTEERVIDMWMQIQRGGYQAAPGVVWNAQQLKYYLSSTHY